MKNRRLFFHALAVLLLGVTVLGTAAMQVSGPSSEGPECVACNLGCPSKDLMDWGCFVQCPGTTGAVNECQEYSCSNGDTHAWSCGWPKPK